MCSRWNGLGLHRLHAHSGFLGNTRCNWNVHFTWKRHLRFNYVVRFPVLTTIVEREFNTEIPRIVCQGWLFSIVYMESAANSNDTSATNCWNCVWGTPVYHWGIPNVRLVTRSRALLSKLNTGKWMAHSATPPPPPPPPESIRSHTFCLKWHQLDLSYYLDKSPDSTNAPNHQNATRASNHGASARQCFVGKLKTCCFFWSGIYKILLIVRNHWALYGTM